MKKKIVVIILLLILILGAVGAYWYINSNYSEEDSNLTNDVANGYILKKYSDYDGNNDQNIFSAYINGYLVVSVTNETFIYKDGKLIEKLNGNNAYLEEKNYVLLYDHDDEKYNKVISTLYVLKDNEIEQIDNIYEELFVYNSEIENTEYINRFVRKVDDGFILIDENGKDILGKKYDELDEICDSCEYLYAVKDGKLSVIDSLKGKEVVPPKYDVVTCRDSNYKDFCNNYGMALDSVITEKSIKINNDYYHQLKKGNKYYIVDSNGKELIESDSILDFDNALNLFYYFDSDSNVRTYYYFDGTSKEIDLSKYDKNVFENPFFTSSILLNSETQIYAKDNKYYVFGKDLEVKEYDNVYNGLIFKNVYVTKENGKYYLKNKINNKTVSEYTIFNYNEQSDYIIACIEENKCGIIDLDNSIIIDMNYSLLDYEDEEFLLYNDEFIISYDYNTNEWVKNKRNQYPINNINSLININENLFIVIEKNKNNYFGDRYILKNGEKISEKSIRNHFVNKNGYIIAEIEDSKEKIGNMYIYDYYIYDKDGNEVVYKNEDNAKFYKYITSHNDDLYFITDKGIYVLTQG